MALLDGAPPWEESGEMAPLEGWPPAGGLAGVMSAVGDDSCSSADTAHPPIGAFGLAPQKTWVPTIPIKWTKIMFKTIDFAVAVPTPTGPPLAL